MPTITNRGNSSDAGPVTMEEVEKEAKSLIEKIVKDVGKASASKQLIFGCTSGW